MEFFRAYTTCDDNISMMANGICACVYLRFKLGGVEVGEALNFQECKGV